MTERVHDRSPVRISAQPHQDSIFIFGEKNVSINIMSIQLPCIFAQYHVFENGKIFSNRLKSQCKTRQRTKGVHDLNKKRILVDLVSV